MLAIMDAVEKGRLLTMEIEFSLRCNFHCPYCYVLQPDYFKDELTRQEIEDVILQAKTLGVHKIIILGGEPTIYPDIREIIQFITKQEMEVELFTNGSGVDVSLARFFRSQKVRVVLKMNTFDPKLQDKISGKKGAYDIIQTALKNLQNAGYPSDDAFMAVSTVICAPNIDELPRLWSWVRDRKITPYFEIA